MKHNITIGMVDVNDVLREVIQIVSEDPYSQVNNHVNNLLKT